MRNPTLAIPTLAILGLLLAVAPAGSRAEDTLGRLFTTPDQRRALDAGRNPGDLATDSTLAMAAGQDASDAPVVVNGVIRRSHGPDVVWVNGSPAGTAGRIRVRTGPDRSGRVVLEDQATGVSARLKPGQYWEPANGRVDECRDCSRPPAPVEPATGAPAAEGPAAETPAAATSREDPAPVHPG